MQLLSILECVPSLSHVAGVTLSFVFAGTLGPFPNVSVIAWRAISGKFPRRLPHRRALSEPKAGVERRGRSRIREFLSPDACTLRHFVAVPVVVI